MSFLEFLADLILHLWLDLSLTRTLAWVFAILAVIALIVALSNPQEYWRGFALAGLFGVLSGVSVWLGSGRA